MLRVCLGVVPCLPSSGVFPIDRLHSVFVDPILVRDPMDESNNVGRNCFRFTQIQDLLLNTRNKILALAAEHGDECPEDRFWLLRRVFPGLDLPA